MMNHVTVPNQIFVNFKFRFNVANNELYFQIECNRNKEAQAMDRDKESIAPSDTGTYLSLRRRIKSGSRLQAAWGLFSEYSDSSTIHGIKYLGEKRRSTIER
jgi:hypothetical protein